MALILNGSDTSAGDNAGLGYTSAEGIIITGQGSTSDVTIKNDADATVLSIPTGSNHVGIGTTSPATELEIYNAGFTAAQITSNSSSETQLRFATNTAARISNQANTALIFDTNATERMRITETGNVGIGASSPSKPLQVRQTAAGSGLSQTDIRATRDEYGADFSGYIDQGVGHGAIISSVDNGTATERVRITNAGNVGIGTSTPENPLTIQDIGGSTFNRDFAIRNGDASNYHRLVLGYNAASAASGVPTNAQFILAEKGGGYGTSAGLVVGNSDNAPLMFTTNATERMRINSDGRIGIASTGLGAVQVAVVINGQDWFFVCDADDGTDKFRVASSGNVQNANNSYGAISDSKLKENIVDASNKLANLKQVKIRNFNFKGDSQKQIGVVAQELETIFPSMVENHKDLDKDGNDLGTTTKSVKYSVFVPMLIKAMQEQQTVIEALEARITALEGS